MEEKDYFSMTVPELKVICRALGLRVKGRKSELIQRIQDKNRGNIVKDSEFTMLRTNVLNIQKSGSELPMFKASLQNIQKDKSELTMFETNLQNIQKDRPELAMIKETLLNIQKDGSELAMLEANLQNIQKNGPELTMLKTNLENIRKEDPKLTMLKTNVLNIQKDKPEILSKLDLTLKNNFETLKMDQAKKDESKIIYKNFKRKPDSEETKFSTNTVDINKEKEYSSHVNSNVSRKLKKVSIKFVKKESAPITDQPKPVIHQITNAVPDSSISALSIGKSPSLALRTLVSKLWNFSVKFAWHQLILLEFPGKRTETWISSVDPTIHNLRLWYIHRQKEKQRVLKVFKQGWIERLFRIYGQTFSCNYPTSQRELWFFGICYNLLSDPDQKGQWEVSVRFWMSRFVLRMMSGESWKSWPFFFDEVYRDMIVIAKRIGNSDIWRIESSNNKVWYISGQSGEAIGWDSSPCSSNMINIENITWKDLRLDWKTYISKIINSNLPTDLFNNVFYHGDTSLYPRGIHKNIKDPLRFSLAKRFVLSHVIEYSISGLYESRPFSFSLNPNLLLDLEQKYSVESVCLSGEIAVYNQILCPGLSYIQTTEIGLFVLDEIGLEVGDDICGVRDIWALILGCNTWGSALDNDTVEKMLVSLFKP
ncbi:unnamed protein product [Pneumocystis jirovecii]|uniref:SAP domain-containing protein n=1 Tax=Pneumocystis jirovecii TaxID=42068 RepID=L0P953_PNEJI|nr:unnamed protein product [Pneumocystis jirovecii]